MQGNQNVNLENIKDNKANLSLFINGQSLPAL